jgi:hypothetical protein
MHKRIPVALLGIALLAAAAFAAEPALPRKAGTPVVYQCPLVNLVVNGESKLFQLKMQSARSGTGGNLVCDYTTASEIKTPPPKGSRACPATLTAVSIVGSDTVKTTDTGSGCEPHNAWCHGPALNYKGLTLDGEAGGICSYSGGSVELFTTVGQGTCFGGNFNVPSASNGSFLCW